MQVQSSIARAAHAAQTQAAKAANAPEPPPLPQTPAPSPIPANWGMQALNPPNQLPPITAVLEPRPGDDPAKIHENNARAMGTIGTFVMGGAALGSMAGAGVPGAIVGGAGGLLAGLFVVVTGADR